MDEVNGTLQSHPSGGSSLNLNNVALIVVSDEVADIIKDNSGRCFELIPIEIILRRLTPTECGRLQGMPDWWCDDVPHSDSAEYKMWGNGMALPCVLYVIEGIEEVLKNNQ